MNTNKKNKVLAISLTFVTVILLVGITYTFFSASVSNSNNEKFSTQTATMSLVFDDNDNGVNATLKLGESVVKKFTIENTGTVDAYGKINWVDLVNTYTDGSLTWKLESSSTENGTYTKIKESNVPVSSSATTEVLKDGLLVPEGETLYYKLTITLNNLDDIDQTSDINASMHSKFNLESGKATMTAVEYINDLAKNGDKNSIGTFNGKSVNAYVLKFDGDIDSRTYDTLSECQEQMQYNFKAFGTNYSGTCELDPSTSKYHIISSGDTRNSTSYLFERNLDECQEYSNYLNNTTCIEAPVACNTFAYDGTVDNNLRYVGQNPCNYVEFNGVEFQIIGVMNNVDNGSGVLESRLKLVYTDSPSYYIWGGNNNFADSFTKDVVSGNFSDEQNECMLNSPEIDNAKWYLRGISTEETSVLAKDLYNIERTTGSIFPGNPTTGVAKIAPFYASDAVLASSGSESDRINCLNKNVLIHDYGTSSSDYTNCTNDNWFFERNGQYGINSWTIMPASNNNTHVLRKLNQGDFIFESAITDPVYHSSIYLSSNTEIISGTGLYNDPYIIGTKNCYSY